MKRRCIALGIGLAFSVAAFAQSRLPPTPAPAAPAPKFDLNKASEVDLEKLPGVGPELAAKIIAGRPYSKATDLLRVGFTQEQIDQITPMVMVVPQSAGSADRSAPAPVWVNTSKKVYYREGDSHYGTTKHGKYMKESEAVGAGYHAARK
jgi:hypothetical protein